MPLRGQYKPDSRTGRLPITAREGSDNISTSIERLGENTKEGMQSFADAIVLKNANILPTVVFCFKRKCDEIKYTKDVLADSLESKMGDVVKGAYRNDISGVFCFTDDEENDLYDDKSVLEYKVLTKDKAINFTYLRPDFDKIIVKSLFSLVNSRKIHVLVTIIKVPIIRNKSTLRSYY